MDSTQTRVIPAGAYLIFGLSGSGKSTLGEHLNRLGYETIDTDLQTNLSGWVNLKTGERLIERAGYPYTLEWLQSHSWRWDPTELENLLQAGATKPVFFCGSADQVEQFFPKFKTVFALHTDNAHLRRRLIHRGPDRWNDQHPELGLMLEWNRDFLLRWHGMPVKIIDSTQPVSDIAQTIINHLAQ